MTGTTVRRGERWAEVRLVYTHAAGCTGYPEAKARLAMNAAGEQIVELSMTCEKCSACRIIEFTEW